VRPQFNLLAGAVLLSALALLTALGLSGLRPDPLAIDLGARLAAPSAQYWLGADEFGRDLLARIATGAVVSGGIALATVVAATLLGVVLGILAGYLQGWTDRLLMAVTDALLAFPGILLALALVAVFGASRWGIIAALTAAYVPIVVRVVRSNAISVRQREYVEAARLCGAGPLAIMVRHVLPNVLTPVAVLATGMVGWVLLSESALSFLGVGVSPPTPTWGNMLAGARPHLDTAPHLAIFPGLCIAVALLGINLLGDALRDRLDPRERR
jgi:peptide/nickel transport system permease protein